MLRLLRQLGVVAAIVIGGVYAFMALRGPNGIPHILEKRDELRKMQMENEKLRQEIKRREEYLQKLSESPELRDKEIRERTNKQKADETTIYLADPEATH